MKRPLFSLNDYVVIYDGVDVEEILRGIKCQIKDYNQDKDEYQLYILEGEYKGKHLWASAKYLWSWEQYRLLQTIDKDEYQEYLHQMQHAAKIRDRIFMKMYGFIKDQPLLTEFKKGRSVRVRRRANIDNPWDNWSSEMDYARGHICKILSTDRKYNGALNEYEDVVKVEFVIKELFNDLIYSYYFLPEHLELQE